jgi:hypothetical protein
VRASRSLNASQRGSPSARAPERELRAHAHRRQRVLDLVRDLPRHLGPCGTALGLREEVAALGELLGHPVERASELGDLVAVSARLDPHAELAATHGLGRRDEAVDRAGDRARRDQRPEHEQHRRGGGQRQHEPEERPALHVEFGVVDDDAEPPAEIARIGGRREHRRTQPPHDASPLVVLGRELDAHRVVLPDAGPRDALVGWLAVATAIGVREDLASRSRQDEALGRREPRPLAHVAHGRIEHVLDQRPVEQREQCRAPPVPIG